MANNQSEQHTILGSASQSRNGHDGQVEPPRTARPVVLACHESYAMPLATALRSIVDANRTKEPLDFYVLSDQFSANVRQKVIDSLPPGSALIHWVPIDLSPFEGFATPSHILKTTYARLLIPSILGEDVSRVLYLDADLLVLDDLAPLWKTDLKGAALGAVVDVLDGHVKAGVPGFDQVPRVQNYFNAGVLLIDLDQWRKQRISEKALEYLACHPHSPYSDQDALNVACNDRWTALDPGWNFQQHYTTKILDIVPGQRPKITHFATALKPWNAGTLNLNAGFYDSFRSRTRFARTGADKVRDVGRSTWSHLKRALKRTSFGRAIRRELGRRA